MNSAIDQYLSLGFVPNIRWAERYLRDIFGGMDDARNSDPADLLVEILEESLRGSRAVVVPLSGGLDSRGVLGAAMRLLPPKAITCLTIAQPDDLEWHVASAICRQIGLDHERIDPNDFVWELDELVEIAKEYGPSGGLPTIDILFIYTQLARRMGSRSLVLSGYFGDAISGKHLHATCGTDEPERSARRFINNNTAARNGYRIERLRRMLVRFIESNECWLGQFCSLTGYDLLDFGFRQAQRVRLSVTGPYPNCIRPYEDPRWVRFWLRRSLADRLNQRLYWQALLSGFPDVFGVAKEDSGTGPMPGMSVSRGDPRINISLRETLCRAAESFDSRKLLPIKFLPNAIRYATSASRAASLRARIVLSAEVHLRAGLL